MLFYAIISLIAQTDLNRTIQTHILPPDVLLKMLEYL